MILLTLTFGKTFTVTFKCKYGNIIPHATSSTVRWYGGTVR